MKALFAINIIDLIPDNGIHEYLKDISNHKHIHDLDRSYLSELMNIPMD